MAFTYRYVGTEPAAFVTIQKNADVGGTIESDVPLSHPLLELVKDTPVANESWKSAVVPETIESPVKADENEEN